MKFGVHSTISRVFYIGGATLLIVFLLRRGKRKVTNPEIFPGQIDKLFETSGPSDVVNESVNDFLQSLGITLEDFETRYIPLAWTRYNPLIKDDTPDRTIERVFKGTEYEDLTPYVIAQAKQETADKNIGRPYTSPAFRNRNNMFGMNIPVRRKHSIVSLDPKAKDARAIFKTLQNSAWDQVLYFEAVDFPTRVLDAEEFVTELKRRGYFTAPYNEYLNGVKRWMQ